MLDGHSNGNEPGIRLLHGTVVIEQEHEADNLVGRWRRMTITVPLQVGGNVTVAASFSIDLPDGRVANEATEAGAWPTGTWAEVVERMGGVKPGGNDED